MTTNNCHAKCKECGMVNLKGINCLQCNKQLNEEEYDYNVANPGLHGYLNFDQWGKTPGYLCSKHWCECMPNGTPWSWLNKCDTCGTPICKTCKNSGDKGTICSECYSAEVRKYLWKK